MPGHRETKIVPYTATQMFDLVADVERYPEFLPWCTAARKIRDNGDEALYELAVGFKMVREKFTSKVTFERSHTIDVRYVRGPLRYLHNIWRFTDCGDGSCEIEFDVEFEFRSRVLQKLIGALFHEAVQRMVHCFELRAARLYAPDPPPAGDRERRDGAARRTAARANLSPPRPAR